MIGKARNVMVLQNSVHLLLALSRSTLHDPRPPPGRLAPAQAAAASARLAPDRVSRKTDLRRPTLGTSNVLHHHEVGIVMCHHMDHHDACTSWINAESAKGCDSLSDYCLDSSLCCLVSRLHLPCDRAVRYCAQRLPWIASRAGGSLLVSSGLLSILVGLARHHLAWLRPV